MLNIIVSYTLAGKGWNLSKISNELQKTTDWKKLEGSRTKKNKKQKNKKKYVFIYLVISLDLVYLFVWNITS